MKEMLADLPPRNIFPADMPRYPNLWFFVDPALLPRPEYAYAIRFLVRLTETQLGLRDTFVREVENPQVVRLLSRPGEGSDWQARIGPLQFYQDPRNPSLSHSHQLHARFYVSPLIANPDFSLAAAPEDGARLFAIPASVHYEVATEEPLHPYVDTCPLCGITGEYEVPVDRERQDYCLKIHDPLGLEFLLHGKIRGRPVLGADGGRIPAFADLAGLYALRIREGQPGGPDPLRMAAVTLGRPKA